MHVLKPPVAFVTDCSKVVGLRLGQFCMTPYLLAKGYCQVYVQLDIVKLKQLNHLGWWGGQRTDFL